MVGLNAAGRRVLPPSSSTVLFVVLLLQVEEVVPLGVLELRGVDVCLVTGTTVGAEREMKQERALPSP